MPDTLGDQEIENSPTYQAFEQAKQEEDEQEELRQKHGRGLRTDADVDQWYENLVESTKHYCTRQRRKEDLAREAGEQLVKSESEP